MVRENQLYSVAGGTLRLPTAVGRPLRHPQRRHQPGAAARTQRGLAGHHEGHRAGHRRLPAGRSDRLRRRRQLRQGGPALQRRAARWSSSGRPPATPRNDACRPAPPHPPVTSIYAAADQRRHEPDRGVLRRRPDVHPGRPVGRAGRHHQPAGRAVRPQRRHHRAGGGRGVRLVPGHAGRAGRSRSTPSDEFTGDHAGQVPVGRDRPGGPGDVPGHRRRAADRRAQR